jgi:hypothetical protein
MVLSHSRALLTGRPGTTTYRDTEQILTEAAAPDTGEEVPGYAGLAPQALTAPGHPPRQIPAV